MANMKATSLIIFSLLSFQIILPFLTATVHAARGVDAIYQFGDSLSDTGNLVRENPVGGYFFSRLPYGMDFFRRPTGRCSDGLLMIDYIARYFRLPFLDPYLKQDGNFGHGVNFAVVGSTALNETALHAKNITNPVTNSSLSVQLNWFKDHLRCICTTPTDCKHKLKKALFMMGEIGGNDINYALVQGMSMHDLQELVPQVVLAIRNAVEEVISLGATKVVVPGNFPIGCMPIYLANFPTNDPNMLDRYNCLKELNQLANFQNSQLQQAIRELQQAYPHVSIIYGDYYSALLRIILFGDRLGFDENATKQACCGSGNNEYNFNLTSMCGTPGAKVCEDPFSHVHWDGVHLTTRAYFHVASDLLMTIVEAITSPHHSIYSLYN